MLHGRLTQTRIHELFSRSDDVIAIGPLTPVVLDAIGQWRGLPLKVFAYRLKAATEGLSAQS